MWQTLLGGIIAITGSLVGIYATQYFQRKNEGKNIASAFYGEISAILGMIKKRKYIEGAIEALEYMNETGKGQIFHFNYKKDHFKVYEQNISKIGLLNDPLPEKIVLFYTYIFAVLQDIEDISKPDYTFPETAELKELFQELLDISTEIITLGEEILVLIKGK
jgi:sugar/nucleoside kinase (ribokinase family)